MVCGLLALSCQVLETSAAEPLPPGSVTFERTLHFLGSDGVSVSVGPGTYWEERSGSTLILTPGAVTIEGSALPPEELALPEPTVLSITRSGDEHLLLYTASDGAVVAAGTYSGIHSRETRTLSPLSMQIIPAQTQLPGKNILPGVPRLKSVS